MNYTSLSKTISHALRHSPEDYDLKIEEGGWVKMYDLIKGIRSYIPNFVSISNNDIEMAIKFSQKKRHEIRGDKIRAIYGHSSRVFLDYNPSEPPNLLFHGTNLQFYNQIILEGIKPRLRNYVHLSSTIDEARKVALRKSAQIVILNVNAQGAFDDGKVFYRVDDVIWLTIEVDVKYLF